MHFVNLFTNAEFTNIRTPELAKNICSGNNSIWTNNINGEIEDTQQGDNIGDCWLLSTLNSMRNTQWGKKAIKDSIRPDGKQGAIVTLKLRGGKETKEIHITKQEIQSARLRGLCSKGDDDVAALELAFKKHYGGNIEGSNLREREIVELLCGEATSHRADFIKGMDNFDKLVNEIEKNPNKYVAVIGFRNDTKNLMSEHSYMVKKITTDRNGKKWVHLVNPWNSSKVQKVSLNEVKNNLNSLDLIEPTKNGNADLDSNSVKMWSNYERNCRHEKLYNPISDGIFMGTEDDVKSSIANINKDNILDLFNTKEVISDVITALDKYKSGWGNGKAKKELIMPLVNALCLKAEDRGIDEEVITQTKNICEKELDAIVYTNEKTIIKALEDLYDKILSHS